MYGRRVIRAGKGITFAILNYDMDGTIEIIKSLENSRVLIDGVSEKAKHETENKKVDFLAYSFDFGCINMLNRKGVNGAGKGYSNTDL